MTKKEYFLLYLISTVFFSLITFFVREPGYMDAEYYYAGGIQIVTGNGNQEPYLWNYLNQPPSIPATSFSYWMPFTSLVAAAGMGLLGSTSFSAARLFFVLIAGVIPLLSAWFATRYTPSRGAGWLAGCSALFCVYYLPYLTITDSFTIVAVLGGLFVLLADKIWRGVPGEKTNLWFILLFGVITGAIHLTRADGALLFALGLIVLFAGLLRNKDIENRIKKVILAICIFTVGYLVVMSGWYIRNLALYQALIPPGNGRLIWAIGYDDIFYYNVSAITPERMLNMGTGKIIFDRLSALWSNIKGLLAVNGNIVLVPIIGMGIWSTRRHFFTRLAVSIILLNLVVMSLVFPYAGYRGGFFHSNSAVQTVLWGLVPIGLNGFIELGVKYRKWTPNRSWKMFGSALIASLAILSVVIFFQKMNFSVSSQTSWNGTLEQFEQIDRIIRESTNDTESVVMVNDPPGFYLATHRMAIVNPSGGIEELFAAARQYNAKFSVIDQNNSRLLEDLSKNAKFQDRLKLIKKQEDTEIYEILQ